MALKNKTHDTERIAIVQRTSKQTVRTENEHEQVSRPSGASERIVTNPPAALRPADIITLQRTVGNRAVQRLLNAGPGHHAAAAPVSSPTAPDRLMAGPLFFKRGDDITFRLEGRTGEAASANRHQQSPTPGTEETISSDTIRTIAAAGLKGPASVIPFREKIQQSFGPHEISGIKAHLGTTATASAEAMNALAYTTGEHVVFAGAPDLHTAAHEAAHVVQQRGGVHLANGLGQKGDVFEQHADAVAARVAAGQSAEALLNKVAGAPGETPRLAHPSSQSDSVSRLQRLVVTGTKKNNQPAPSATVGNNQGFIDVIKNIASSNDRKALTAICEAIWAATDQQTEDKTALGEGWKIIQQNIKINHAILLGKNADEVVTAYSKLLDELQGKLAKIANPNSQEAKKYTDEKQRDKDKEEEPITARTHWTTIQTATENTDVSAAFKFLITKEYVTLNGAHRCFLSRFELNDKKERDANKFGLSARINPGKDIPKESQEPKLVTHLHCDSDGTVRSASIKFESLEKAVGNGVIIDVADVRTVVSSQGLTGENVEKTLKKFD